MNPGIEAVRKLVHIDYRFTVNGETIKAKYHGPGEPDPAKVRPLLVLVKEHKPEVLAYLSMPNSPERILTCYECGQFHPAFNSPNPTQAFGRCEKRGRGRYGCATACQTIMNSPEAPGEAVQSPQHQNQGSHNEYSN